MFKREDLLNKETLIETSSRVGIDISNMDDVKIKCENKLKVSAYNFARNLDFKALWKLNQFKMYDISAELFETMSLKLNFDHKFATVQNVLTTLKVNHRNAMYAIISEFNLPKSHILNIMWPGNKMEIISTVDLRSLMPFNISVNQTIKRNNNILAKIVNMVTYNNEKMSILVSSNGKTEKNLLIYHIESDQKLNGEISTSKVFYDYSMFGSIQIPSRNVKQKIKIEQFADINILDTMKFHNKTFISQIWLQDLSDNKNVKTYGYNLSLTKQLDFMAYNIFRFSVCNLKENNVIVLKFGKENTSVIVGISMNFETIFITEIMYKLNVNNKVINSSIVLINNWINKPKFDFYCTLNCVLNSINESSKYFMWNWKYGKKIRKDQNMSSNGIVTINHERWKRFNIVLRHDCTGRNVILPNVEFKLKFHLNTTNTRLYLETLNSSVQFKLSGSRVVNYYGLGIAGNIHYSLAVIETNLRLTRGLELNEILLIKFALRNLINGNFIFNFGKTYLKGKIYFNINQKHDKEIIFSFLSSIRNLKELSVKLKQVSNQNLFQLCKLTIDVKDIYYTFIAERHIKREYNKRFKRWESVTWSSNIPYIESGYNVYTIQKENSIVQINSTIIYNKTKLIDFSFATTNISKNAMFSLESHIMKSFKFFTDGNINDSSLNYKLELTFDDQYFKISKMEMMYLLDDAILSASIDMIIKTNILKIEEIKMTKYTTYNAKNVAKTYKSEGRISFNGTSMYSHSIDFMKGLLKIETRLIPNILRIKVINFNSNFEFQSIYEFNIDNQLMFDKQIYSELKLAFFKMIKNESILKLFKSSLVYALLDYKRKSSNVKALIFVDKNKKNAIVSMRCLVPEINLRFDELNMTFENIKDSAYGFTGSAKYNDSQYMFKYEIYNKSKQVFRLNAIEKTSKPQNVMLTFDFTNNYFIKFYYDQYFMLDVQMRSAMGNNKSGLIQVIYKGNEIIKLGINSVILLPQSASDYSDILLTLFQLQNGTNLKFDLIGKFLKKQIKTNFQLYHLKSVLYPEGSRRFSLVNLEIIDVIPKKFYFKIYYDENLPKFRYNQQMKLKVGQGVNVEHSCETYFTSFKNVTFRNNLSYQNFQLKTQMLNSQKILEGNLLLKHYTDDSRFGFRIMKENYEISFHLGNSTIKTNFGNLVKEMMSVGYLKSVSIGREYYILLTDLYSPNRFEFKFVQKSDESLGIFLKIHKRNKKIKIDIRLFNKNTDASVSEIEVKGETFFEIAKVFDFIFKSNISEKSMAILSNLNINRINTTDIMLEMFLSKENRPNSLTINYKGTYSISAKALLDIETQKFTHFLEVKPRNVDKPLWYSTSSCVINPDFECGFTNINERRHTNMEIIWKDKFNLLELNWNKLNNQGFLLSCERLAHKTLIIISTPIRQFSMTITPEMKNENQGGILTLEIIRKGDQIKKYTFGISIAMSGSIQSDYNLYMRLSSNLMHRDLEIYINREVSLNIGKIYSLSIKLNFIGEEQPFLTIDGYLSQLTSRSYRFRLNATNNDNYFIITSSMSLTYEETNFEYTLSQNNMEPNKFTLKFIPFKKLLITNKRHFIILFKRTDYQYGYRRDMNIKFGRNSSNITGYATFTNMPFKYYAEVIANAKKLVFHFRPMKNMFIGDLYRKISGKKVQDMFMNISQDKDNILRTKLYWNPHLFEIIKNSLSELLRPENLKVIIIDTYYNSENYLAPFTFKLKDKILKSMNVALCIEFVTDIVDDFRRIPHVIREGYNNDEGYIKTTIGFIQKYLTSIEILNKLITVQNYIKNILETIKKTLGEWIFDANLYRFAYNSVQKRLKLITYSDIILQTQKAVNYLKLFGTKITMFISSIGQWLDSLSKSALSTSNVASKFSKKLMSMFSSSTLNQVITLFEEVRKEVTAKLNQVPYIDFIKEWLLDYDQFIKNTKELFVMTKEMNTNLLNYFKSSSFVHHITKIFKLVRSMKFKEAFLFAIKPEVARLEVDLNSSHANLSIFVSPVLKKGFVICKTLSDLFDFKMLFKIQGSGVGEKLLDIFYKYEYLIFNFDSIGSLRKLLPPFKTTAWILNGYSILTYDGSSIRIEPGKCTYIMARDIKTKSFTLLMHIKTNKPVKEFELLYIKNITFDSSRKVKVDGVQLETLPRLISVKNKTIEIIRNHDMITIRTSEGLVINYFLNLDYLKITLDGYWHGLVKGFLGSNDFDVVNDWSTPNGRITHDTRVFSGSWSIGKCKSQIKRGLNSIKIDSDKLQECVNLFKADSNSYLERCFSIINPEPYFQLCQASYQYLNMSETEFDKHICDISRNYVVRCKAEGIMIRLKTSCVKCGSFQLGSLVSKTNLKKKLKFNYIFIVEQSKCLLPYMTLVTDLFKIMSLEKENIFTLLAFNGLRLFNGAHFKSFGNSISVSSKGFEALLTDLISPSGLSETTFLNVSNQGNQAIYDSIKMPSKSGYLEKIIFISCSKCSQHSKYIYSVLAGLLKEAGVSLTYLTKQNFTGTGFSADTVGLENNKVYYFERNMIKIRTWKKDLQAPSDVCSSLTQLETGIVWSLTSMNSVTRQRRAAEKLHTILKTVKGNPRQTCFCGTGNYEEGKVECKVRGLE